MRSQLDVQRVLELNRKFHDQVEADTYDSRMGVRHGEEDVRRTLEELERVVGRQLPAGGTVIDLGAGTGNLAVKLARSGRFERVVAVDISAGMLERAAAAARAHACTVETVVSDMERLPFDDASVDCVVGCAVLHHVPDPVALMAEVRRVLKPGAPCAFIGEPSQWGARLTYCAKLPALGAAGVLRWFRPTSGPRWDHDDIDVHTFTPSDIACMTAVGFDRVQLRPEGLLEPIVDQALLVPLQWLFAGSGVVARASRGARQALAAADRALAPVVPPAVLASLKFSAVRSH